tara:strand:- start:1337 stop:1543 length:207 start_codon:yes stop_codon:yes gene_type:complete
MDVIPPPPPDSTARIEFYLDSAVLLEHRIAFLKSRRGWYLGRDFSGNELRIKRLKQELVMVLNILFPT